MRAKETGIYKTEEELEAEVIRMSRLKKYSQQEMADCCEVEKHVVRRILESARTGGKIHKSEISIRKKLNQLWIPTSRAM
jgi:predicted DNA-binding protein (UPF0251 family)